MCTYINAYVYNQISTYVHTGICIDIVHKYEGKITHMYMSANIDTNIHTSYIHIYRDMHSYMHAHKKKI